MVPRASLLALLFLRAASAFTTAPGRTIDFAKGRSGSRRYSAEPSNQDGDLFPSDPASTTPQFLSGLWQLIAKGNSMVRGVS